MSKIKNFIMDVQEFVWEFYNSDGDFVATDSIKDKDALLNLVEHKYGSLGLDVAIVAIKGEPF